MEKEQDQAGVTPPAEEATAAAEIAPVEELSAEQLLLGQDQPTTDADRDAANLKAVLEAVVYVISEPMTSTQIAAALGRTVSAVEPVLKQLTEESLREDRGLLIREVAGGYQMSTKPEHHEAIRGFVRNLKQPLKLSQAALETLAVVAYKQPITVPEILEIRGVQGAGVLKTLLDRKLIAAAGRKKVIGNPILYKTTKEFLTQFGLKDLAELPSLKEFEEIRRQSLADEEIIEGPASVSEAAAEAAEAAAPEPQPDPEPEQNG